MEEENRMTTQLMTLQTSAEPAVAEPVCKRQNQNGKRQQERHQIPTTHGYDDNANK